MNKINIIAVVLLAVFLVGYIIGRTTLRSNGVKANGFLSVSGTQLVNQKGKAIQLRGMSSHGVTWHPAYVNTRAMLGLKNRGANMFRVAMYADSANDGYNAGIEYQKANKDLMYMAIENTLAADMYAIADWHLLMDENPLKTVDSAIAFFDELSAHYADEPGVIYEICNEPNGSTTWQDVYEYAMQVIPVIRNNSPQSVILVGTPEYSADVLAALVAPLPYSNIMYSYHMYTGTSGGGYEYTLAKATQAGLPVFVTEWGISRDADTNELNLDEAHKFIEYMRKNKISWANWSLSNADEDYSAIKSDVTKLSGWSENDLSTSGRIIFEALGGKAAKK